MTFDERIAYFTNLFAKLSNTSSTLEKKAYIAEIPDDLQQDWTTLLECLTGKRVFGYTWKDAVYGNHDFTNDTITGVLYMLLEPKKVGNLTLENICRHCGYVHKYTQFFQPIVNRTLKIGVGESVLSKSDYAPMLARKLEDVPYLSGPFTVTEKLDGNRCIAFYDGSSWNFMSRNGKPMHVQFDMHDYPTDLVYDGEILSPQQVEMSKQITHAILYNLKDYTKFGKSLFNETSGLINRHNSNKNLIYNIFDIITDSDYTVRRSILEDLRATVISKDTRILPVLFEANSFEELMERAPLVLDTVTDIGGEGLMINVNAAEYEHKRTKTLLKYKKVKTMDMLVVGTEFGTGKYECAVGALYCKAYNNELHRDVFCKVGTGLSDEQRFNWVSGGIIGKIVEVSYFDISDTGSAMLSLRFPRLKRVRNDKVTESAY